MSATNRGAVRNERDFYATPEAAFAPLLKFLPRDVRYREPAAGDGRLVRWLRASGRSATGADLCIAPVDSTQRALIATGVDFLKDKRRQQFIVTNPPYSLAMEFCDHALQLAPEVLMLLRLNFLGAVKRREWWRAHEPAALFILSSRPSFGNNKHGKRGTDATEYAWFYWGNRFTGIRHL